MQIEIDTEELEALIQFQEDMIEQALESCEFIEANERKVRAKQLRTMLRRRP